MSPSHVSARTKLSYPLYAADFDPLNPDFLIVGGGGGYSSTGVANKITLVDTARRNDVKAIVDIDLPADGDSCSSIAVASSTDTTLTAYAGVNSSLHYQKKGFNEHLRVFRIELPSRKEIMNQTQKHSEQPGRTEAIASLCVFSAVAAENNESYQRITRLSPAARAQPHRLAAVATGLAKENELCVIKANSRPTSDDLITRINSGRTEVADVDFSPMDSEGTSDTLAYCTEDRVYLQKLDLAQKPQLKPYEIYETPASQAKQVSFSRPKFRALRYLTSRHILLLQNLPSKTGAEIVVLRLTHDGRRGGIQLQKRLNKGIKSAVGLDVCHLSKSSNGQQQFVAAIAGQNGSIEVLTLDYTPVSGFTSFRQYAIFKDVHSGPLTKICFSAFLPPPSPVTKDTKDQQIKLASVGVDQYVVVHSLPLRPYPPMYDSSPRYVLIPPGQFKTLQQTFSVVMAIFVVGLPLMQFFLEIRGGVPSTVGAAEWLSPRLRRMIAQPYQFSDNPVSSSKVPEVSTILGSSVSVATETIKEIVSGKLEPGTVIDNPVSAATDTIRDGVSDLPSIEAVPSKLHDLIQQQAEEPTTKVIVMRADAGALSTELHDEVDAVRSQAVRRWDELTEHEQKGWRQRLSDAGHWSASQGDTVLQGVFFSELAGFVGGVVGAG